MNKYKYKKQVYIGIDADGKLVRKWIYSNSKDDLIVQKNRLREEFANGGMSTDPYFIDYATRWLKIHKAMSSESTRIWTERCIRQCEPIHYLRVSAVTPTDCQEIINAHAGEPQQANKLALVLGQIFSQLVEDGLLKSNPARSLKVPKKIKKPQRTLLKDEIELTKALIAPDDIRLSPQEKLFLAVLYYFGLRPEEARALTKDDFDWKNETVTISRALAFPTGNQGVLKETKTYNVRTLPMPMKFISYFKDYLLNEHAKNIIFYKDDGDWLSMTSYRHMWENHILRQIPGVVPYSYRRNYATNLYYSGISMKKAAYLMGHANTKMIMEIYAQIDDERENLDALRKIE